MTDRVTGKCLCGAVRYSCAPVGHTDVCHCGQCRRWGGGPAFGIEPSDIVWEGEEAITVYASSDWAERGFCSRCGTNLFYRLKDGAFMNLNAFTLDDVSRLDFTMQIYVEDKPGFYDFANDTRRMTGAEVVAAFAGAAADDQAHGKDTP